MLLLEVLGHYQTGTTGNFLAFFNGQMLPKYFTHACLVLLPKVKHPNKLA
ncbi:hypothetical protein R3W88_022598 [Solanum pinnatisectum]|uniref:Uncharacterized protein n=1 Tax=Solanum pinnatisectum TaxID=50273 RepID=A0AAV9LV15_9SOLN|nr:hypothetical protein R3W88_022598 [Solanum pinnatisectum]